MLIVGWVLFPLLLAAVCLGCGLAVEWVAGRRLPGALLLPVGFALVIVAATLTTRLPQTASWTTPVVVVLTLAGYALGHRRLRTLRPDPWLVACVLALFALCAAPVVLSGNDSFLGYFVDTDPAFHMELASWLLNHGYSLTGVPVVTTSAVLALVHEYLSGGYPIGADVALGAVRPLAGQDLAWLFAPYLAVVMTYSAMALHELFSGLVSSRPMRALCAFIAAQPSLAYAFYLDMSVKELVVVVIITLTVILVVRLASEPLRIRALAPLVIVAIAGLDTYSVTIVPWLGIALAVGAVTIGWGHRHQLRRRPSARAAAAAAGAAVLTVFLALPVLVVAVTFASEVSSALGSQGAALGNLAGSLSDAEAFGIWPNGDYRFPTISHTHAYALIAVAAVCVVIAVAWAMRRRAAAPLLLLAGDGLAAAYLLPRGSPYADSKVLMILSVGVMATAMLGAAAVHESGRRIGGWLLAAIITVGVMWSNLFAYHDSSVAPAPRFRELASIGAHFAGQGQAFYNLWDTYGAYFLRRESAAVPGTFAGAAPQPPGTPPHTIGEPSTPWDPNELLLPYMEGFKLLVLDRSPLGSRPPANYALAYQGRFYDVWRRSAAPGVLAHIGLSDGEPAIPTPPPCTTITRTAARAAREDARLAYATPPPIIPVVPARLPHPANWAPASVSATPPQNFLSIRGSNGVVKARIDVPAAGRYQVWLQGSISRKLVIRIGDRIETSVVHETGAAGQFTHLTTVTLPAGPQSVEIDRPPSSFRPGDVVNGELLGPLVLTPDAPLPPLRTLAPAAARSLCGKPIQWLEIIR